MNPELWRNIEELYHAARECPITEREALLAQAGPEAVATMRALKHALDPGNVLNPGKVLPDP